MERREQERTVRRSSGDLREALWLAGADIRKSWISFPVAALTALVPGLYVVLLYSAVSDGSMSAFGTFLLDAWFLLVVAVLNVNFLFNRDYYYRFSEDNYTKRLSFLRGLPIRGRAVVAGRAMYMAVALVCGAPSFFLAPYLASPGLRAMIDPLDYAWFVGIWIGYALFAMGFLLFMWNGLSFQAEIRLLPILFPGWCFLTAAVSNLVLGDGLTMALIQMAKVNGPFAAVTSLAIGCAALILWATVAERWLRRRELG